MEQVEKPAVRIRHDTIPPDQIKGYFEQSFQKRIYNPLEDAEASQRLQDQVSTWKEQGKTVVFTSGVYDIFHANHRTYLLHTKIAAAPYCWEKYNNQSDWKSLSQSQRSGFIDELVSNDLLKLVVSVDGNDDVAARKGFNPEKGNNERPIFDWQTRARDVLSVAHESSQGARLIADAVTIHDGKNPGLSGTLHTGIMEIAECVRPDVWSVYFESEDVIEALQTTHKDSFSDTSVFVLSGHDFYHDRLLGGPFKTTSIVRRIGGAALNGKSN